MEWKDLAPWIAIAFTLALSILVPLFTQIANNRHQRKMRDDEIKYEEANKKKTVYEDFLLKVGAAIFQKSSESFAQAGAVIKQMYIYSPEEWWLDLDTLSTCLREYKWGDAETIMRKFSRLIANELA